VSLVAMCAVAYTGFSTIVKYLGAVLEVIYPLFIVLVVGKLIQELYLWRRERKTPAL
jgi:branched-subunit amino acid permease